MYSLILGGGLGNQMFQYAFARYLSLEYGIKFKFSLYSYNVNNTEIEFRNFSLGKLNIIDGIPFETKLQSIVSYNYFRFCLLKHYLEFKNNPSQKLAQKFANDGCFCTIGSVFNYYDVKLKRNHGVIYGGFQSAKYFEKYSDIIKNELKVKSRISKKNESIFKKICSSNSVAVHIRRGDYLNPKYSYLNVCSDKYFENSISFFKNKKEKFTFFVFSNNNEEIEWIKNNYKFLPSDTIYVNNNNKDYEDLQLMYSCKHFILSNSTFSWWAQYLSDNNKKIVIAPKIWYKNQDTDIDIYQDNWIRMDIE